MTVTEFLRDHVAFLSGLTEPQVRQLALQVEQKRCKSGQTILFKGVTVDGLHVVAEGKVAVFVKSEKEKTLVKVAELGPGDVFGETSIVEMNTAMATIKCAEDETLIFVIPQEAFREVMTANPEFKARVDAQIAARKAKAAQPPPEPR